MSTCNYCIFLYYKKTAKKRGLILKKFPSSFGLGGCELFMVPKSISISEIKSWKCPSKQLPNGDVNWQKYQVGWMMEIPDHCCC